MQEVTIEELLNQLLPDEKIKEDLAKLIWADGKSEVELDDSQLFIPQGTHIYVINKMYFRERYILAFRAFRTVVSVGEFTHNRGMVHTQYCFARLYYDKDRNFLSVNFNRNWLQI